MSRTVLAFVAALALAVPAFGQGVRITLTDGTVVQGELQGYEHGRYRVRLPSGQTREIDERKVRDVSLVEPPPAPERATPSSAAAEARSAFERGDFETALRKTGQALQDLDRERAALLDLMARSYQALLDRLLEQRDAARLSERLRQLLPALPPDGRRLLFARLADRFRDMHRAAPADPFTLAFAEILARLAGDGGIPDEARGPLADVFVGMADAAFDRKDYSAALALTQGALRLDPRRREALRAKLLQAQLAEARRLLDANDPRGAAAVAREALALDPSHADARALLEDAEFAQLKQDVEADYGADAAELLRSYLARVSRAEHRAWAEQALGRVSREPDPRSPAVIAQMRKYFPLRPGRWLLYRRADGEIHERMKTDSIVREGDVLRVFCTLQEIFRDYSTSKVYLVEIEKDAVLMPAGTEREPLLKFPLRPGDSWAWTSRGRGYRRTVRSIGDTVEVGPPDARRSFSDCLVVEFTSTVDREGVPMAITSRSTYAPSLGLVKLEFLEPEHRKYSLELAGQGTE
jgi:tetratricopeptide (TPR) repeat protein